MPEGRDQAAHMETLSRKINTCINSKFYHYVFFLNSTDFIVIWTWFKLCLATFLLSTLESKLVDLMGWD